jgi:phage baseplate assembly protein gpV
MDAIPDIRKRLAALESKVASIIRVGVVDTVDRTKCRVTVTFPGGFKSAGLPVMVKQSVENRDFWMPAVDEQVLCVFLPTGTEAGFVLGSFYSDEDAIPEGAEAEGMRVVEFADGARFEFSTEESKLRILVGELEVTLTPDLLQFGGEDGNQPFVRGTDLAAWLKAHVHPTGVGPSGPPTTAAQVDDTLSTIIKGR